MPQDVGCKFFNEYKLCYQTLRRGGAKSGPRKIITVHKQFIFNNEHFSSQIPAKIYLIVFTSYETSVRHCYMLHVTRQLYSLPSRKNDHRVVSESLGKFVRHRGCGDRREDNK